MITGNKTHAIVNPASAGGTTGKNWSSIRDIMRRALGDFTYTITEGAGHAESLTDGVLDEGVNRILVVGGDGTLSEVINSVLSKKRKQKVNIGIVNQGTGGDFSRTLGISTDLQICLDQIRSGHTVPVDAGKITYQTEKGQEVSRYFINIAGCGMAGEVSHSINQTKKTFGAFSYYMMAVKHLFRYQNQEVIVEYDDQEPEKHNIVTIAVCNGQFFGGGMQIAPGAQVNDGRFDIVSINNWNAIQKLRYSRTLYNGTIRGVWGVKSWTAKKIHIRPVRPDAKLRIDVDGECPGILPVTLEVIPKALSLYR